ncbi:unnamed protein product [Meloidogyne enterolobii]|uniref:Uncharacterized protein n=1 Tax=Meloidogyne enterolobii TaxID=390850 RepID=A0ACB0YPX1_MELEN
MSAHGGLPTYYDWSKETNIQLLECYSRQLCNTQAEFERVLFCLIKGWDELEPKRKMCYETVGLTDYWKEPCFINRREDGKGVRKNS